MKRVFLFFAIVVNLSAFSMTNIQYLYGSFDDNSYVYDTKNGGKSTITLEHYSAFKYMDIYAFVDYCIAEGKFKYRDTQTDTYGEFSPRFNLSSLSTYDLSFWRIKQLYAAFQYNSGDVYNAFLYGIGSDLSLPGFDVFGLNLYRKNQNIGKYTYQLSLNYTTKKVWNRFFLTGFTDWTEYDLLTQNQFLFSAGRSMGLEGLFFGVEWHYYRQKSSVSAVKSNTFQAMAKYAW